MIKAPRVERQLAGSRHSLRCVAVSGDGRHVAAAGDDMVVRVYSGQSGSLLRELIGHFRAVKCISFAPDALLLATAGDDETTRLWPDACAERCLTLSAHKAPVTDLCFISPKRIATCSTDGHIYLQSSEAGGNPRLLRRDSSGFTCLASCSDLLVAGTKQGAVIGLDVATGQEIFCSKLSSSPVASLCSGDAGFTFIGYEDGCVRLLDITAQRVTTDFSNPSRICKLRWNGGTSTLFFGDADGVVGIWSPATNDLLTVEHHKVAVLGIDLSTRAGLFATGDIGGALVLWRAPSTESVVSAVPESKPVSPAPDLVALRVEKIVQTVAQLSRQLELMQAMIAQSTEQLDFVQSRLSDQSYK